MNELLSRTAHEVLPLIESGEVDHVALQEAQHEFARRIDPQLNAFISWDEREETQQWDLPLGEAKQCLHRLPYAAKDIFTTAGLRTTAGSKILDDYIPPYDATCVAALHREKNRLVGKTNMDEFAMGSSGEMSAYGSTKNPWAVDFVPGGSSSGSAAAVAACQCFMALGTDTGGSVRQPASFCGIVGFRPSYGQVSRYGLIAYASSCDQAGIFCRSSLDVALTMNTIAAPDPLDSTCQAAGDVDFYGEAQRPVHWSKLRIGVLKPFLDPARIDPAVLANYNASLKTLEDAGAQIIELDFPLADLCLASYYIITGAECSSNLARYDGIRFGPGVDSPELRERYIRTRSAGFGAEVKRRILLGTYVLSAGYFDAYYNKARTVRKAIRTALEEWFQRVDILATPTSPTLPFKFGERLEDPVQMYMSDLCTVFVNLTGTAGINLPNGFGEVGDESLPTGLQLVCAPHRDALLLRVAAQFEELTGWHYTPPAWVIQALAS